MALPSDTDTLQPPLVWGALTESQQAKILPLSI